MTTTPKYETKRVPKTVMVEEEVTVGIVHDLPLPGKSGRKNLLCIESKEACAKVADILHDGFYWGHAPEGPLFWSDVRERLLALASSNATI